jgi:hypothetical protein
MTKHCFYLVFDDLSGLWTVKSGFKTDLIHDVDVYESHESAIRARDLRNAYDILPEISE